jgi:hypothetical protein
MQHLNVAENILSIVERAERRLEEAIEKIHATLNTSEGYFSRVMGALRRQIGV